MIYFSVQLNNYYKINNKIEKVPSRKCFNAMINNKDNNFYNLNPK